jgi:hypothetical protein
MVFDIDNIDMLEMEDEILSTSREAEFGEPHPATESTKIDKVQKTSKVSKATKVQKEIKAERRQK